VYYVYNSILAMKKIYFFLFVLVLCLQQTLHAQDKLNVVICGLSHDHVNRILEKGNTGEINIIGIAEGNLPLANKKKAAYKFADTLFYPNLAAALKKLHPDLVMVFDAPVTHLPAIETALPYHIPVMVEKPLCVSNEDAARIAALSKKYNTQVFTNYPSHWYISFNNLLRMARGMGPISKMVMRGGHRGPAGIGCSSDFQQWLTDSTKNGGGAIMDFGCYGVMIMTDLMGDKLPTRVLAVKHQVNPSIYPKADDDATIILQYPAATGVVQASWAWPYTIMDAEAFSKDTSLYASQFNDWGSGKPTLTSKIKDKGTTNEALAQPQYADEVAYLTAVIKRGAPDDNKLLSLERNVLVTKILVAARQSSREGRTVVVK